MIEVTVKWLNGFPCLVTLKSVTSSTQSIWLVEVLEKSLKVQCPWPRILKRVLVNSPHVFANISVPNILSMLWFCSSLIFQIHSCIRDRVACPPAIM